MNEEEWRPVERYGGWYEVSSFGRIRSWHHTGRGAGKCRETPRIMTPHWAGPMGYLRINAKTGHGPRTEYVHVLVTEAWHGPRPDGKESAHEDGNHLNNIPSNLSWKTSAENDADRWRHGTYWMRYANKGPASNSAGSPILRG